MIASQSVPMSFLFMLTSEVLSRRCSRPITEMNLVLSFLISRAGMLPAPEQRQHAATRRSLPNSRKGQLREWRRKMSKGRGIWCIGLAWSRALDGCKRTAGRYWRFVGGMFRSATARSRRDQLEVPIGSCQQPIKLNELINLLRVGDRIRVLCDDGVIVAEKTSQTQFKLIHCQAMSELVH